jgi:hypothetical protein
MRCAKGDSQKHYLGQRNKTKTSRKKKEEFFYDLHIKEKNDISKDPKRKKSKSIKADKRRNMINCLEENEKNFYKSPVPGSRHSHKAQNFTKIREVKFFTKSR